MTAQTITLKAAFTEDEHALRDTMDDSILVPGGVARLPWAEDGSYLVVVDDESGAALSVAAVRLELADREPSGDEAYCESRDESYGQRQDAEQEARWIDRQLGR